MNDRRLEFLLAQRLGGDRAPDLCKAVYGADDARRQQAVARAQAATAGRAASPLHRHWSTALVTAAATLIVVMGMRVMAPANPAGQHVDRKVVKPADARAFARLLGEVERVRLRAISPGATEAVAVTLDAEAVVALRKQLTATGKPAATCRRGSPRELEFQLAGRRVMYAQLQTPNNSADERLAVVVDGMPARVAPVALREVLAPWVQRLETMRGRLATRVRGGAALGQLVRTKNVADIRALVPSSLDDDDLALLARLSGLREVDLTQSPEVQGATFAASAVRDQIVTVSLLTAQLGEKADWLGDFKRLDGLRVTTADWVRSDTVLGARCVLCHIARRRPPLEAMGDLSGLTKTRRIRRLAVQGAVLAPGLARQLAGLPLLRTLDLSGCDARDLDLSALARLPELRELSLAGCFGIPEQDLSVLRKFRGLRRLDLRGVVGVETGEALAKQLQNCDVRF